MTTAKYFISFYLSSPFMVSRKFNMQVLLQAEEKKKRASGSTRIGNLIELLLLAKEIFNENVIFI